MKPYSEKEFKKLLEFYDEDLNTYRKLNRLQILVFGKNG